MAIPVLMYCPVCVGFRGIKWDREVKKNASAPLKIVCHEECSNQGLFITASDGIALTQVGEAILQEQDGEMVFITAQTGPMKLANESAPRHYKEQKPCKRHSMTAQTDTMKLTNEHTAKHEEQADGVKQKTPREKPPGPLLALDMAETSVYRTLEQPHLSASAKVWGETKRKRLAWDGLQAYPNFVFQSVEDPQTNIAVKRSRRK